MTDFKAIVGVIVLYKSSLEESITIASLNESLECIKKRLKLLVYDNSPESQHAENNFEYGYLDITYIHDPTNPGISKAYNEGFSFSGIHGAEWILLLDQDTKYHSDFFESYLGVISEKLVSEIVCLIPLVLSNRDNSIISPTISYPGGITRPLNKIKPGIIINKSLTGINSGTIISVKFIESIGGFTNEFQLDMLDHWYFNEIKRRKRKILLLNSIVHHNLSVFSFFDDVPIKRYNNILISERKFFKKNIIDLCIYKFRLIYRAIKQLRARKKEYAKLTLKYFYR